MEVLTANPTFEKEQYFYKLISDLPTKLEVIGKTPDEIIEGWLKDVPMEA